MIDLFDSLGNLLNDMVSDPTKNNVDWAHKQIFGYDEGGVVGDDTSFRTTLSDFGTAAAKTLKGNSNDPLGSGFYHSPQHIAYSLTNMGKFFHVSNTNEMNVNRFNKSDQSKPIEGEDPAEFFSKWYLSMRRFSEAAEVAQRGQTIVRST